MMLLCKQLGRAVVVPVRIEGGEAVQIAVRLVFGADGALLRLGLPPVPSRRDPREAAARRLLEAVGGRLARPGAPGVHALRRAVEAELALLEQLEELEAQHGGAAAAQLARA